MDIEEKLIHDKSQIRGKRGTVSRIVCVSPDKRKMALEKWLWEDSWSLLRSSFQFGLR